MDAVDLVTVLRAMRQALDEHERRLTELEHHRPAWRYSLADGVAQRRAIVRQLRESGLSYAQIALATGAAVSTVERDLHATPHQAPAFVLGEDGKRHPTVKNGHRPQA